MTTVQDFFDKNIKLPSPPAIALKILKAVRENDNSSKELSEIIKVDPALTVQVLQAVNSSLYGLQSRVASLSQAITLIGTLALRNIALSFVIVKAFRDVPEENFNLDFFWKRAVTSAVAADIVAKSVGCKDQDIFVSALLQDIGVLIIFLSNPDSFTAVLDSKRVSGRTIFETEKEQLGFDHTEIGYHFLKTWDIPDTICGPIRYHHSREPKESYRDSARILNVADKISAMYNGTQSNKKSREVHQDLKKIYQLKAEQIDSLIDTVGEKVREIMDIFSLEPGEIKPFSQIIQEANDELGKLNFSYEQMVLELKQAKQNAEELALDLKRANDILRERAFRDDMTGLYNHRFFQEALESEIQRAIRYKHPVSLLILDIDSFKNINDTFGHLTGDYVLKEISEIMLKLVRPGDIVARYGGEEFTIILPDTGKAGANVLAQRVRRGIKQYPFKYDNHPISVTISIGLASSDMNTFELTRMNFIDQSDQALYRAKRNGKDRVEF
jgi:diguanylate cyclase (GGDEF)-like protein